VQIGMGVMNLRVMNLLPSTVDERTLSELSLRTADDIAKNRSIPGPSLYPRPLPSARMVLAAAVYGRFLRDRGWAMGS